MSNAKNTITAKRLPAKWQYCVWVVVILSMVLQTYKLIPKKRLKGYHMYRKIKLCKRKYYRI